MSREARGSVNELRAVSALIVAGPSPELVGPCTLVTNGTHVFAVSSADLLHAAPEPLAIALTLDCKKTLAVTSWAMSRTPHMGLIELGLLDAAFPPGETRDVEPLPVAAVCATVDTRGAPAALVAVELTGATLSRRLIPVHVDAIDGGGMSDEVITRLASPQDAGDSGAAIEGAALFAWMPADPVLSRPPETIVVALACSYPAQTYRPRDLAPIAELHGLDDLGRVLPWRGSAADYTNTLGQIAGEIRDVDGGPVVEDREGD